MSSAEEKGSLLAPWQKPSPATVTHDPALKVMNSLTRQKDHFITSDGSSKVNWYMYVIFVTIDTLPACYEVVGWLGVCVRAYWRAVALPLCMKE